MSLPPDLRVLCRRLTSTPSSQLPQSIPALVRHVIRCKDILSTAQDPKDGSSEASMLVHKLKTIIATLLNGKNSAGRFTGATLVKAAVDVGGWECLRESGPWVRGLLSILQKNDPPASKELCVVALVRIYTLISEYQTLAREIATPTLPTFFNHCLQLVKLPPAGQRLGTPLPVVETILEAFSTLQPVYPATCRPFNGQIRTAIRKYLAPTSSDDMLVPRFLQRASRRLAISLHFNTAGKTGPGDDWTRLSADLTRDFHDVADQVFRAVQEGWEPSTRGNRSSSSSSKIDYDGPPQGKDSPAALLPGWKGVRAGSERLVGLLRHMADALRHRTAAAVTVPVGALLDAVHRVALISRNGKSQPWDQALETRPAIGREEKEELWSVVPSIHVAALDLVSVLVRRLGRNALPLAAEMLDSIVLVLKSGIDIPAVRAAVYRAVNALLPLGGPGMSKPAVDAIGVVALACCRDLQQDAGYLADAQKSQSSSSSNNNNNKTANDRGNGSNKKNGFAAANADLFLPAQKPDESSAKNIPTRHLSRDHRVAAERLLANLLSQLPQRHLKPGLRGLLDQTAVLCQSRDAMLASVLNPYVNGETGRAFPAILPHLLRRFPHDQGVEVLRSHVRTAAPASSSSGDEGVRLAAGFEELEGLWDEGDENGDEEMALQGQDESEGAKGARDEEMGGLDEGSSKNKAPTAGTGFAVEDGEGSDDSGTKAGGGDAGPFLARQAPNAEVSGGISTPQKRKHDEDVVEADPPPPKKQEMESKSRAPAVVPLVDSQNEGGEGDDSDDDESVHLNMDLDDLDDDVDEEEDEDA